MPVSARALFDWHERPGAFERLTPGWQPTRVIARSGGITDGSRVEVEVPVLGGLVHQRLLVEHRDYVAGSSFRDVMLRGPFERWEHTHTMEPAADGTSVLVDRIEYTLPMGPLGEAAAGWFVRDQLEQLFEFRHARTRADLELHQSFASQPRLTVAITGGTGMIGSTLTGLLRTGGHTVRWITRRPDASRGDIGWDPDQGELDPRSLAGVDAVVHLAGANVGERWTKAHKAEIRRSRELGTRTLVQALTESGSTVRTLISSSAIGFYGDAGEMLVDETTPAGVGFLAEVCQTWESETAAASAAGLRVAVARTGIVLSPTGGALAKLLTPFKLGLGGPIGSGRQLMSWISLDDQVAALYFLLMNAECRGTFNLTAPAPVTNAEFARTLGDVLDRPALLPLPGIALTTLFGEMADQTILRGARVMPARLQLAGFRFRYPTLDAALRFELGRMATT